MWHCRTAEIMICKELRHCLVTLDISLPIPTHSHSSQSGSVEHIAKIGSDIHLLWCRCYKAARQDNSAMECHRVLSNRVATRSRD